MDSCFPDDIMVDILSRLPPKPLMRFKCVRKSWDALIKSSDFAAKQLSISKKNKSSSPSILFMRRVRPDLKTSDLEIVLTLASFDPVGDDKNLDSILQDARFPVAVRTLFSNLNLEIACHCDGIVCIFDKRNNLVLCNPSTKEFKLLPKFSLPSRQSGDVFGFGFDNKSKSYKLVRVSSSRLESTTDMITLRTLSSTRVPPQAEVYNLLTNSWAEIETGPLTTIRPKQEGVYCKGFLYWIGDDHVGPDNEFTEYIISFDISGEKFHLIVPPPTACSSSIHTLELWNNESVALRFQDPKILEIWVIDDASAGVDESTSWTKKLTLSRPSRGVTFPILTTLFDERSKQLVLVGKRNGVVIFFSVHTREFKYLPLDKMNYGFDAFQSLSSQVNFYKFKGSKLNLFDVAAGGLNCR